MNKQEYQFMLKMLMVNPKLTVAHSARLLREYRRMV